MKDTLFDIASQGNKAIAPIDFYQQVNEDLQSYSRYVCDSRAIPNLIDGLKPVQRRILWTMWKSAARDTFTKTVKVAGMTMAYHPHGNTSIEDAIASMTQGFAFANNYPLIDGEGAFGDVVDPKAIASARYTEIRLSAFAKGLGLFESLDDIDYISNYDETDKEPLYFVPKVPLILLNPALGIATGFKCCFPARRLKDLAKQMYRALENKKTMDIHPWYRGYNGTARLERNERDELVFETGFGFSLLPNKEFFLTDVPENWNREKVIEYLENLISQEGNALKDYQDFSTDTFKIQLFFKKGIQPSVKEAEKIFTRNTRQIIEQHAIMPSGTLEKCSDARIIEEFLRVRKAHLIRRFKRLALQEKKIIQRETELIRFISEKWNLKVTSLKDKADLVQQLTKAGFHFKEFLAGIPVYRLTVKEVANCKQAIREAKKRYTIYHQRVKTSSVLKSFIIEEVKDLVKKWNS